MFYFKRKVMYPDKWTDETSGNIDKLFNEYQSHVLSIKDSLPEGALALSSISFHDAQIKAVTHFSKKAVEITIEGGGYDFLRKEHLSYGDYTLLFSGVKKAWVPHTIVGNVWLYNEIHLSDVAAFDYQVLLDKDEIRIQADDIVMRVHCKTWSKM